MDKKSMAIVAYKVEEALNKGDIQRAGWMQEEFQFHADGSHYIEFRTGSCSRCQAFVIRIGDDWIDEQGYRGCGMREHDGRDKEGNK